MALFLGGVAVIMTGMMWALSRSPLGRAIGLSVDCFADASRGETGALR